MIILLVTETKALLSQDYTASTISSPTIELVKYLKLYRLCRWIYTSVSIRFHTIVALQNCFI